MSEEKSRHWMASLLGSLYIGLYFGWFIWSESGWVATLIWASWLFFVAIMGGVFNMAEALRPSLAVLFLIFSSLLPRAFRFFPVTTVISSGGHIHRGTLARTPVVLRQDLSY